MQKKIAKENYTVYLCYYLSLIGCLIVVCTMQDPDYRDDSFFDEIERNTFDMPPARGRLKFILAVMAFLVIVSAGVKYAFSHFSDKLGVAGVAKRLMDYKNFTFPGLGSSNGKDGQLINGLNMNENVDEQIDIMSSTPEFVSELYHGLDDPNIEKDLDSLRKLYDGFAALYKPSQMNGMLLLRAMEDLNRIYVISGKLSAFVHLSTSINRRDEKAAQLRSRIVHKISDLASKISFFQVYLSKLPPEDLSRFMTEFPGLEEYLYVIEQAGKYKNHVLHEETESYAIKKDLVSNDAWVRMYDLLMSRCNVDVDGMKKGKGLNLSELLNLFLHKNRDIRMSGAAAMGKFLDSNADISSSIYRSIVRNGVIEKNERNYNSVLSMRNLGNDVEDSVVESLIRTVKEHYKSTSHRYYQIKAELLKLDKLHYSDRSAPLNLGDSRLYDWDEAKRMVLSAYQAFSPKMKDIAESFFTDGRIHAKVLPYKDSGAYCISPSPESKPYVVMNYMGKQRDVFTLAHELGHGIHGVLSNEQKPLNYSPPTTTAEIASIFGERLLLESMMNHNIGILDKVRLLSGQIEDTLGAVVRQIAFTSFEQKIHSMSSEQDLTDKDFSRVWLETQKESLGAAFDIGDDYGNYWTYIQHFFHYPFYVYSYAFANLLVDGLYRLYKSGKVDNFVDQYLDLLSKGNSANYADLLRPFGIDLSKPDFWEDGLRVVEGMISELEDCVNSKEFEDALKNVSSSRG